MKLLYGNHLVNFRLVEEHGPGFIKLRYGHGLDRNGAATYFDSLILRASDLEIVEATENELRIVEEAMKKIPEKVSKPLKPRTERFWKIEYDRPRLPKGSRKTQFMVLYRDPFTGHEGQAEIMRGGIHDGYLYCKAPYAPSRLFIRFRIKGKEFKVQIPFKVKWIPEVS